jgi:hypothetical protein
LEEHSDGVDLVLEPGEYTVDVRIDGNLPHRRSCPFMELDLQIDDFNEYKKRADSCTQSSNIPTTLTSDSGSNDLKIYEPDKLNKPVEFVLTRQAIVLIELAYDNLVSGVVVL